MENQIDPGTGLPMTAEEVTAQGGAAVIESVDIEVAPEVVVEEAAPEAPVEAPAETPTE